MRKEQQAKRATTSQAISDVADDAQACGRAINEVVDALADTDELIDHLTKRLSTALAPRNEPAAMSADCAENVQRPCSELASRLFGFVGDARVANRRLTEIIDRIDLP